MTVLDISIVTCLPREGDLMQLANALVENLTPVPQNVSWLLTRRQLRRGIARRLDVG
jgi:hypothetical protein